MPTCLNDSKRHFSGNEPSPKGLGFCAHAEKEGTIRMGRNQKEWIVKADKHGVMSWKKHTVLNLDTSDFKKWWLQLHLTNSKMRQ